MIADIALRTASPPTRRWRSRWTVLVLVALVVVGVVAFAGMGLAASDGEEDGESEFEVEIDAIDLGISYPILPPIDYDPAVTYTVENTGESADTQEITLSVEDDSDELDGDAHLATHEVTLEPGESHTDTFEPQDDIIQPILETTAADDLSTGEVTVVVASEDDRATETIVIGGFDGPSFEVTEVSTNTPVAGEDLEVAYEVRNTGDVVDTQEVTVDAEPLGEASELLLLNPGETRSDTVSVATEPGDAGEYDVGVATEDDTSSTVAEVVPADDDGAFFDVTIERVELDNVPDPREPILPPVEPSLDVTYSVENTGNSADEQDIRLRVEGQHLDSHEVALEPGGNHTDTFSVGASPSPIELEAADGDIGIEFTVTVASDDDSDSETVAVDPDPPAFEITDLAVNEPVEGDPLEVAFEVTNNRDIVDFGEVTVDAGPLGEESILLLMNPGETVSETMAFDTEPGDAGEYEVRAATRDDAETAAATVLPRDDGEPFFDVSIEEVTVDLPEPPVLPPIEAGLMVNYTVENAGEAADEQEIVLSLQDIPVDRETVALDVGESHNGTFDERITPPPRLHADTDLCIPGEHCPPALTIAVSSEDDTDERSVELDPPVDPPVALDGVQPRDLNGDGLARDLTGSGDVSVMDVQELFDGLESGTVQESPEAFNFAGVNPDEVTIFDVQALFDDAAG